MSSTTLSNASARSHRSCGWCEGCDVGRAAWQEFSNFGGFVGQWKTCEGKAVRTPLHNQANVELYQKITEVKVERPVLSATVVNKASRGQ